jgi:hypothetical protein
VEGRPAEKLPLPHRVRRDVDIIRARRGRRAAQAKKAKAESRKQANAKREAKMMKSPVAKQLAQAMAKALES